MKVKQRIIKLFAISLSIMLLLSVVPSEAFRLYALGAMTAKEEEAESLTFYVENGSQKITNARLTIGEEEATADSEGRYVFESITDPKSTAIKCYVGNKLYTISSPEYNEGSLCYHIDLSDIDGRELSIAFAEANVSAVYAQEGISLQQAVCSIGGEAQTQATIKYSVKNSNSETVPLNENGKLPAVCAYSPYRITATWEGQSAEYVLRVDRATPEIILNEGKSLSIDVSKGEQSVDLNEYFSLKQSDAQGSLEFEADAVSGSELTLSALGACPVLVKYTSNNSNYANTQKQFVFIGTTAPFDSMNGEWVNAETADSSAVITVPKAESATVEYSIDEGSRQSLGEQGILKYFNLADGEHSIGFYVGEELIGSVAVKLDKSLPSVGLEAVGDSFNATEIASAGHKVKVVATDAVSGLESVSVKINGNTAELTGSMLDLSKNQSLIKRSGTNSIELTALDKAGNAFSKTYTYFADFVAPSLSLSDDDAVKYAKDSYVNSLADVILDVSDDYLSRVYWTVGILSEDYSPNKKLAAYGLEAGSIFEIAQTEGGYILSLEESMLTNGSAAVTVFAKDESGNEKSLQFFVNLDTTAPTFELSYNGSSDTNRYYNLLSEARIFNLNDNIGLSEVSWTLKNSRDEAVREGSLSALVDSTLDLEWDDTAEQGLYTLSVTARDKAGNATTDSISFGYDRTVPEIARIKFSESNPDAVVSDKVINVLTYGVFCQKGVKCEVELTDEFSGIDDSTITVELKPTEDLGEHGFAISDKVYSDNKLSFNILPTGEEDNTLFKGTVKLTVADRAGNSNEGEGKYAEKGNYELVLRDLEAPIISDFALDGDSLEFDGRLWTALEDDSFSVSVQDGDSGLGSVSVSVNGKRIISNSYYIQLDEGHEEGATELISEEGTTQLASPTAHSRDNLREKLSLSGRLAFDEDGCCEIVVVAVDNVGNTSSRSFKIYLDNTAPTLRFYFDGQEISSERLYTDLPSSVSFSEEYGFFFSEDCTVEIKALDSKTQTAKIYYIKSTDAKETVVEELSDSFSCEFTVQKGFKGFISASAEDLLGNRSADVAPHSMIIESQQQHDALTHFDFYPDDSQRTEIPATAQQTESVVLDAIDDFNGIASLVVKDGDTTLISWSDESEAVVGEVEVRATEKNLTTRLRAGFSFETEAEHSYSIELIDKSGNTSKKQGSILIDKTDPTISEFSLTANDGKLFTNEDRTFYRNVTVEAEVADTNLAKVKHAYSFGGSETLIAEAEGITAPKFTFDSTMADGEYTLSLLAQDRAGRETAKDISFMLDNSAPVITGIFMLKGEGERENITSRLGTGEESDVYFLEKNTRLLVEANDGEGSAIKAVELRFERSGDEDFAPAAGFVQDEENPLLYYAQASYDVSQNGYIVELPQAFIGHISARATDNLDNESINYYPNRAIAESQEAHTAFEEHIKISLPEYPYDKYNSDVEVKFDVLDTFAGINRVTVSLSVGEEVKTYRIDANASSLTVSDGDFDNMRSEEAPSFTMGGPLDKLITELSDSFIVSYNQDNITIKIDMLDNCGNSSTAEASFSIDKDSPVAEQPVLSGITYQNEGKNYANEAVTAAFAIKDREIGEGDFCKLLARKDGKIILNSEIEWKTMSQAEDLIRYETDYSFTDEGSYELTFSVKDKAGNTASATESFIIDKTAPEFVNATIEKKDENKILNILSFGIFGNGEVKITVTAADAVSGLRSIALHLDNDANEADKKLVSGHRTEDSLVFDLSLKDYEAAKTISFTALDNAGTLSAKQELSKIKGNTTSSNSKVMLDSIAPSFNSAEVKIAEENKILNILSFGIFGNGNAKITVAVSDADSGIQSLELLVDGKSVDKRIASRENYVYSYTQVFDLKLEDYKQAKTISFTVVDNAGNATTTELSKIKGNATSSNSKVMLDSIAPSFNSAEVKIAEENKILNILSFGIFGNGNAKITVAVSDADSGIQSLEILVDGESVDKRIASREENLHSYSQVFDLKLEDYKQAKTISFTVVDNAGNATTTELSKIEGNAKDRSSIIMLDNDEPMLDKAEIALTQKNKILNILSFGIFGNGNVKITVTAADDSSGVESLEMLVDGKSVDKRIASRENYVYSYTQVFDLKLEDYKQAKTISFTVVDNAGNEFSRPLSKILGNTTISNSLLMLEDSLPTAELEVISNDHTTADGRLLFNVDAGYKIDLRDEDAGIRRAELWLVDDFDNEFSLGNYAVSIEGKVSSSGFTSSMDNFSGEITGDSFAALELNGSVSIASHPDFDNLRLKLEVEDMAGNKESFMGAGFATDSTKPVISSVSYDNNSATNGNYYASSRTASITINEHNFDPAGVSIQGNASQASFPAISTWSQSGDVWTASLSFTEDGVYSYTIKVTDRAGNESELFTQEEFVIDKTAPTASISGIAHNSASNSEDAIVFYVTADDTNIDSLVLSFNVSFMSEGEIIERSYSLAELEAAFGVTSYTSVSSASQLQYTISIPNDSALFNDGIYFMSVSVADKAGNSTNSVSCTTEDGSSTQLSGTPFSFSVNRHGSTYRVLWEDGSSVAENNAKTYETAQNIVIEEINVDEVDRTAAGSYISLSDGTESRSIDSAIDGQKNTVELRSNYSIYSYTVEKENFSLSRLYTLEIASADNSGNTSDGQSKNICRQSFVIDNDAPVISLNVDDNSQYQVSVKTIEIAVSDITACEVELYIGKGENRQQPEGIKLNGEAVEGKVIKLPAGNNKLSFEYSRTISELQVIAKDSVGHTAKVEKHNITISDNALIVQFVGFYTNNTVLFYVIIAALLAAIFAVIFFVARKRRKGK